MKKVSIILLVAAYVLTWTLFGVTPKAHAQPPQPIRRGFIFDLPVTGAASVFTSSLTTVNTPVSSVFRVTTAVFSTNSVVNVTITKGGKTYTEALNGGTALTAGQLYTFSFGVDPGCTFNVTYTTTTTLAYLLVEECASDSF